MLTGHYFAGSGSVMPDSALHPFMHAPAKVDVEREGRGRGGRNEGAGRGKEPSGDEGGEGERRRGKSLKWLD